MRKKGNKIFKISPKKNKTGEVSVNTFLVTGFRTLTVSGKIKVPLAVSQIPQYSFQSIINSAAIFFLGLFSFLRQKKSKYISTYSIPEKASHNYTYFYYDITYIIEDRELSTRNINEAVLKQNHLLEKKLYSSILEELNAIVYNQSAP